MGEGGGFSWGGVEGWGEKAYNCNWITIKIFKKQQKINKIKYSLLLISISFICPSWSFNLVPRKIHLFNVLVRI